MFHFLIYIIYLNIWLFIHSSIYLFIPWAFLKQDWSPWESQSEPATSQVTHHTSTQNAEVTLTSRLFSVWSAASNKWCTGGLLILSACWKWSFWWMSLLWLGKWKVLFKKKRRKRRERRPLSWSLRGGLDTRNLQHCIRIWCEGANQTWSRCEHRWKTWELEIQNKELRAARSDPNTT